jgi:hypothetical protein
MGLQRQAGYRKKKIYLLVTPGKMQNSVGIELQGTCCSGHHYAEESMMQVIGKYRARRSCIHFSTPYVQLLLCYRKKYPKSAGSSAVSRAILPTKKSAVDGVGNRTIKLLGNLTCCHR